jgi:hypothetical protein
MSKDFQHNDPSEPSVQQVEGIKGQAYPIDQRVISAGHYEQGNLMHISLLPQDNLIEDMEK